MSFLSKVFRYENEKGESITFTFEKGFLISKPVGIDSLTVNLSQAVGVGQIGATIQSVNIQPRPVNITGKLVGPFQTENKDRLISVIRPDLEGKLYADDFYLVVKPTATPTVGPNQRFAAFSFSLLAAYPYWRKSAVSEANLSGVRPLFKFPWNLSRQYQFGQEIKTQFINVRNNGQISVPFSVTFLATGPCTNPRITNVNTGKYILLNKTLVAGEEVVVKGTHERTYVTSTEDGDIRGALSLKSTFTRLDPGDNVLKPDADSGGDDLRISIRFAEEVVGVTV